MRKVKISVLKEDNFGTNIIELLPNETFCQNNQKLFEPSPYYYNGQCYGLVMPNCLASAGPLEIEFEFFDQTEIFLHHLGQFLSPNSRPRLSVKVGQFIKIAGTKISKNLVNFSDGSNTILSNIDRTRTPFFEHRTNSNVFIY